MSSFFVVAYLAGVLTIASPCILPILPFVLARADTPFRRGGLPMLLGLVMTFAAVASLAAVAGGWAVEANRYGRTVALAVLALFGLAMLLPGLATAMSRPAVSLGVRLAATVGHQASTASSLLLGVATGLLWTPCAGPVLGLILTGAALRGASLETSLLLLAYGMGAATVLAVGVLLGRRVLAAMRRSMGWSDPIRRVIGAAVVAGAATIWLNLDTGLAANWPSAGITRLEQTLLDALAKEPAVIIPSARAARVPTVSGPLASLPTARQWFNSLPLQPGDLAGKVVIVNFWTYSCINCLRVLPHVRAWARNYGPRGLVVVGVHTPEFAFEKDAASVRKALRSLSISYPVAIDNDFGIWRSFGNQAWPALYFFDADGRLRHRVLGEGDYEHSEKVIEQLLTDAGSGPASGPSVPIVGQGPEAAPDASNLRSGETYIGYAQASGFASPGGIHQDAAALYRPASALGTNRWSLSGTWTIGGEFATLNAAGGRIAYRFHARDLHLVLAPASGDHIIRFRVTLDGKPPGVDHGTDVDADGWGSVQDGRLYQLIRQSGRIGDRNFEIEFFGTGVRAYAFTFG
jgi:cytochrome c biogenesis protein CcdA/thiol-disulfide isomerase/thioredoxin